MPTLVDSDGPRRRIVDANYRRAIAEELGHECPEVARADPAEEGKRTLAGAPNLARRQLTREQKRRLIADQLGETPGRSNRRVAEQLGVHHETGGAGGSPIPLCLACHVALLVP